MCLANHRSHSENRIIVFQEKLDSALRTTTDASMPLSEHSFGKFTNGLYLTKSNHHGLILIFYTTQQLSIQQTVSFLKHFLPTHHARTLLFLLHLTDLLSVSLPTSECSGAPQLSLVATSLFHPHSVACDEWMAAPKRQVHALIPGTCGYCPVW